MIFKILIRHLLGFVNISIQGYYIERFINYCISKNIFLWNVKIVKSTYAYANVGIKDFKRLKIICKKTKCRVSINNRKGLPFFVNKYRKRKVFFVFIAFIAILIFVSSRFIWNIEIHGLNRINENDMMSLLSECGLKVGSKKSGINTKDIINKARLEIDDIAWMNIDLSGTNVIIEVTETTEKPEIIPADEYCNIVSTKQAEIAKITAINGTAQVKVGDIVEAGSILIGGWMEGQYTGIRYVHGARRSFTEKFYILNLKKWS